LPVAVVHLPENERTRRGEMKRSARSCYRISGTRDM
jgi:hypothetical protein